MSNINHWAIIGLPANRSTTANAVKRKVKFNLSLKGLYRHPNKGGSTKAFQNLQKAQNRALENIASGRFRRPTHASPPRRTTLNKKNYAHFANEKNYASWVLLKNRLRRSPTINNINSTNNRNQKIRSTIEFYAALNNKKNNAMLNYLYHVAFGERRRSRNGQIIMPHRHGINNIARRRYGL